MHRKFPRKVSKVAFDIFLEVHTLGDMNLPKTKIVKIAVIFDCLVDFRFAWIIFFDGFFEVRKYRNKHILGKFEIFVILLEFTLPETKITLENRPSPKKKLAFQPSIFRGYVSFRKCIVYTWCNHFSAKQGVTFVCVFCCRHFFSNFSQQNCAVCS